MRRSNQQAVAFLRVSSHRQKDNTSHDLQQQEIESYCAENGLEIVKVVRMVESAKDSQSRTKYREGINWALRHKIHHIVFYIFDRETRNLTDNEQNENLVRSGKISLHYARERRVYNRQSDDSDFFLRDVQAVTSKQFIRRLRTSTKDSWIKKAKGGWYPGNQPTLGYRHEKLKDANGNELKRGTIIVPGPEKAVKQVQREFELRAKGYSCEQIRTKIIEEGFIPATEIINYHRGTVENRIRNRFYWGEFSLWGVTYEGKHELIIPRAHLEAVAASFNRGTYQRKPLSNHGILGGGWMKCADPACGCHIVYDPKTKGSKETGAVRTFHYYHCTNGRRVHVSMRGMNVTEEKLWDGLGAAIERVSIPEDLANKITAALNETHEKVRTARRKEIQNYRDGLKALENEEDGIYQDLRRGILTEEMYQRQLSKLRENRRRFTDLLESSNLALDGAYLETAKNILELAKDAKALWETRSPQERLDLIKTVLSNPRLEGANVRYDLKKPFSTLALMKDSEDWRSRHDSNVRPLA